MKARVLDLWAILEWISGKQPASNAVGTCSPMRSGHIHLLMSVSLSSASVRLQYSHIDGYSEKQCTL